MWPRCASTLDIDDEGAPQWHPLGAQYDIMVGNCACASYHDLAGRVEDDSAGVQMTAHFSCLKVPKPGVPESDADFMRLVYSKLTSCERFYYLTWYRHFVRGMGAPLEPLWEGPPVPWKNTTHDELVSEWKKG